MSDLGSPAAAPAAVAANQADEEDFRLLTSFNDIFVTLAIVLVLSALAWFGTRVAAWLGGAAVAVACWLLGEVFTRRRRMALPSIVLVLGFVGGASAAVGFALPTRWSQGGLIAAFLVAAPAAVVHWRRFRVPITVALGASAGFWACLAVAAVTVPGLDRHLNAGLLLGGLALFATAMWWDSSDRARVTRRSDVAFWLHLVAAPLIVHPVFAWIGLAATRLWNSPMGSVPPRVGAAMPAVAPPALDTAGPALVAVAVYLLLGLVAVAVDRRAILVSALFYVITAMAVLFRAVGALSTSIALTALLVGGLLLALSVFWRPVRRLVLAPLPAALRDRMPAA